MNGNNRYHPQNHRIKPHHRSLPHTRRFKTSNYPNEQRIQNLTFTEKITFRIYSAQVDGPTVSVPRLSMNFQAEKIPSWLKQFDLIRVGNQWNPQVNQSMFLLCLDSYLKDIVANDPTYKSGLNRIKTVFFPTNKFHKYKRQLENLHSDDHNSIPEYLAKVKQIVQLANNCLNDENKLSDREIKDYFMKGMPSHLQEATIMLGYMDIDMLASQLEEIQTVKENFYGGKTKYQDRNNRWCKHHRSRSHWTSECRTYPSNKSNTSERNNFIQNSNGKRKFCCQLK